MQNLEWGNKIAHRHRSRDKNGKFRKFKVADGRHFENGDTTISQLQFTNFDAIWYADANFDSESSHLTKIKISNHKMADGRHLENRFSAISRHHIARLTWNMEGWSRNTCRHRSHDQNWKFQKFEMADIHHFENGYIAVSAVNHPILMVFDIQMRIWISMMATWCKTKILQIPDCNVRRL